MEQIKDFKIIGIATETTNKNGKSAEALGKLWEQFYAENVAGKIPNKKSDDVYSIYTDYESDYTGNYKVLIGQIVGSLDTIPHGLIGREFNGGTYQKFLAKGQMPEAVVEKWKHIWAKDNELNRKYTADFEVYGKKSQNGEYSEVDIYIAMK